MTEKYLTLQKIIFLMIKNYFYSITMLLFLVSFSASAQETKAQSRNQDTSIEGLNFYPNPVSNGKIYITSKLSLDKDITIFDVLGKKVLQTILNSRELNIAALSPGVYIIKIKEGEATATRKLIIK
ncbi:MAG: hypothetical protein RL308_479 [Bacteroidota bacterium]